jgi:putative membrane protein
MRLLLSSIAALMVPCTLAAHESGPLQPDDLWRAWELEPGVVILLAVSVVLYAIGARSSRGVDLPRRLYFWSGMAVLAIALISPLHPLGEVLFSAHMAQHEILMLIAAPLLVLSRPAVPLLWGLPFGSRRVVGRGFNHPAVQRVWTAITRPFSAWWIHAVALWGWHLPSLFQATLQNEWIHTAQHLSFFVSALLFWWALFYGGGRSGYGSAVVYIFTTAIHTGILGALLTFSPLVIYPAYTATTPLWGLTPLEDQQLGGLIMWVPASLVYIAAGLALFAAWLRESDVMAARRRYAD